jgi:hypothetical protein
MQTTPPAELITLLTAQNWTQFQVYGVSPRIISLHLVGNVSALTVDENRSLVRIAHSTAFYASSNDTWRDKVDGQYLLPGRLEALRVQPIGKHRLAVIFPGEETLTTVLFGKDDDERSDEPFPGFFLRPIDLATIIATPHRRRIQKCVSVATN